MPEDAVTVARRMFAGFSEKDPDTALELMDQDIEWTPADDEPETGTLYGKEAVIGLFLMWSSSFDDFRCDPVEFIDGGESAVVPVRISGRMRGSGVEVTNDETMVLWVRDGKIVEVREFRTEAEARAAAGLTEDG
jgi:ketosteroid isomerase-like protein